MCSYEGKEWPQSLTSTENVHCVVDADRCRQIHADNNSMVSAVLSLSI